MSSYKELMPVSQPSLGKDELKEVGKVFKSHWLGLGSWVMKFEERLKRFLSSEHVIAVNNGTCALHLALESIGIGKNDEVIVPSLTFAASVQAITATGAKPVFCDVEGDTLNMDISDMKRRITRRTKAIMPVHYSGLPCDMGRILKIAKQKGIRVIEDAAHAFGSYYKGKRIGSFGDIACFSFDPIKNITCGEGGAIATNDKRLAGIIYKKRILGIDKDTWSRYKHKRDWFYTVNTQGFRYHMNNVNAAIGMVQIDKFNKFNKKKKYIVRKYDIAFNSLKEIDLLKRDYKNTAPFNYIVKVKSRRNEPMKFLKERKIDSGVHYIPNHLQPFFKRSKTKLPVTEKVWQEILTLPLYYGMTDKDQKRVINVIKEFYG